MREDEIRKKNKAPRITSARIRVDWNAKETIDEEKERQIQRGREKRRGREG